MDIESLKLMSSRIRELGAKLCNVSESIDRVSALIAAFDSQVDQEVYDMGKALTNETARKLFRDKLRSQDTDYVGCVDELQQLKSDKIYTMDDRNCLKMELELCILDERRITAEIEKRNMEMWIEQTDYIASQQQIQK